MYSDPLLDSPQLGEHAGVSDSTTDLSEVASGGSYQMGFAIEPSPRDEEANESTMARKSGLLSPDSNFQVSNSPSLPNIAAMAAEGEEGIPNSWSLPDIAPILEEDDVESEELLDTSHLQNANLNERYQSTLDRLIRLELDTESEGRKFQEKLKILSELVEISELFISTALLYGRIIISEAFLPESERSVKPIKSGGQLGGRKYLVRGILYKFSLDDSDVFAKNRDPLWASSKIAGHELKGLKMYQATNTYPLCYPLCCLINYMGLQLVAMTELPIGRDTLVYGSDDAGMTVKTGDPEVNGLVKMASTQLKLCSHKCGPQGSQLIHSAVDLEGHRGRDKRIYLIDFSRSMPPIEYGPGGEHLYRLFRPEFLQIYGVPLSSDGYSRFQTDEVEAKKLNLDLRKAASHLHETYIPTVVVTQLLAHVRENVQKDLTRFRVSTYLQQLGVNTRYLGRILSELDNNTDSSTLQLDEIARKLQDLILVEISSRAIKNFLRSRLRNIAEMSSNYEEFFFREVCFVFNSILCTDAAGRDFFIDNLYDLFEHNFFVDLSVYDPLDLMYDPSFVERWGTSASYLILKRTKKMMGVKIAKTAMTVLRQNSALFRNLGFLDRFDIVGLEPRLKHSNIVEVAKASLFTLRAQLQVADISKIRYFELAERHWQNSSPNTADFCVQYADLMFKHAETLKRHARSEGSMTDLNEQLHALGRTSQEYFARAVGLDPANAYILFKV